MGSGTVVYLHGMGGARPDWAQSLSVRAGIIAPDYSDLLDSARDIDVTSRAHARTHSDAPPTSAARDDAELARQRASYLARQRTLADIVQDVGEAMPAGSSWPSVLPHPARLPDRLPLPQVLRSPVFGIDQVGRYLDDAARREAVLDRVRDCLQRAKPPVVVLAHSLGSVVAVDVLADLPCDLGALVTLGSPLGHRAVADAVAAAPFPYARVGAWANLVHLLDPVPFGRGLADRFPAAHDIYLPVLAGLSARSAVQVAAPARSAATAALADARSAFPWLTQGIARAATAHLETTYLSTRTMNAIIDFGLDRRVAAA